MNNPIFRKRTFLLCFVLVFLLSFNFTILRALRNTLAVVDLSSGAHFIPLFELFGALPGAILFSWLLTKLLRRFSLLKVFLLTITSFVTFFLLFSFGIYPFLKLGVSPHSFFGSQMLSHAFSLIFYVVAELWKPALMLILFWGLINQCIPFVKAKELYAPLMFGASLGSIASGPFVAFATTASHVWQNALTSLVVVLSLISVLIAFLYFRLYRSLGPLQTLETSEKPTFKESVLKTWNFFPLRLLSWMVIADYIAYSLGEVIFLDLLKRKFPDPCAYCHYFGLLSFWSGLFTVLCALFLAPLVLKKFKWTFAALITPLCLLFTEGLFFVILRFNGWNFFGWTEAKWLMLAVTLGSLQYALCRATKYTFFDATKELAFVWMPKEERMPGKVIVDGIGARLGRGSSSALSLIFISVCGGVLASAFVTGIVALAVASSWLVSVFKLGRQIDHKEEAIKEIQI